MKKLTALDAGRPAVDSGPAATKGYWWNDPERLLARVVALAENDPRIAVQVLRAVAELARADVKRRDFLREQLKASKPSRAPTAYWQHLVRLNEYNLARARLAMSHSEAVQWLADRHHVSESTARDWVTKARKIVDPSDLLDHASRQ